MALRRYNNDKLPFPTPRRNLNVYHSPFYHDQRYYPYEARSPDYGRRRSSYSNHSRAGRRTQDLLDKSLDQHGDLGWTLEYATAWSYKFLVGNQTKVADIIDKIRELEELEASTPYVIFDYLDKALFGGKLKDMVYLRWKSQASYAYGTTSAPGVVPGIPRICIDLNREPFEGGDGDLEDLLDAMIHQMIHAFFLVCCGAQPKGAKQDGRLADGLHFGVLLHTIRDISRQCQDGALSLIFYASNRRKAQEPHGQNTNAYGYVSSSSASRDERPAWISINPLGSAVGSAPADGQTHCSHDNRKIRAAEIRSWQVEHYSRAIDLNMEYKGDVIYDLGFEGKLVSTDRLKGPPSSTYIELIWEKKRIMVPREKSLKFESLRKPFAKNNKMELKVPHCSMSILRLLYDFLQHRLYWEEPSERMAKWSSTITRGPPVIVAGIGSVEGACGMLEHIRVFKIAEAMKFGELQEYALKRLYDMPTTSHDPIEALKEVYNDTGRDSGGPIHAELHKWARKFLGRRDDMSSHGDFGYGRHDMFQGLSNHDKILQGCSDRFNDLYRRNAALKDDCKLVCADMAMDRTAEPWLTGTWDSSHGAASLGTLSGPARPPVSRSRRWSNGHLLNWHLTTPYSSAATSISDRIWDDTPVGPTFSRSRLLDWSVPSGRAFSDDRVCQKYYSRDERLKNKNLLTGESYIRLPTFLARGTIHT